MSGELRVWRRIVTVTLVALVVSLWGALPIGAGDPLGQITEFTKGLTPDSQPNRIAEGPDGNMWFTEISTPDGSGASLPQARSPNTRPT